MNDDLMVHAEPFCQVMSVLGAFSTPELAGTDPVVIKTKRRSKIPQDGALQPAQDFKEGDLLVVESTATTAFSGHLYVDYFDGASNVVHIQPSPIAPVHRVSAGQRVVLGDQPCPACYEVFPPHGRNMIIAISSSKPLLQRQRPEVERLDEYLPVLRTALEELRANNGKVVTTYRYIRTHE